MQDGDHGFESALRFEKKQCLLYWLELAYNDIFRIPGRFICGAVGASRAVPNSTLGLLKRRAVRITTAYCGAASDLIAV